MKTPILTLLFLSLSLLAFGQAKIDNTWVFGAKVVNTIIDFERGTVVDTASNSDLAEGNVSVSDDDGYLLFYSNGCKIYNKYHGVMKGGDSLSVFNYCEVDLGVALKNFMVTFREEEKSSIYHLYYLTTDINFDTTRLHVKLHYAKIDMQGDNGSGEVLVKNVVINDDYLLSGSLQVIRKANSDNYWMIVPTNKADLFYMYEIQGGRIVGESQQIVSEGFDIPSGNSIFSVIAPDGSIYAMFDPREREIWIFDFDRATGMFSNERRIDMTDEMFYGGLAISPNSRFLYAAVYLRIYQFDLWAADIGSTRTLVGAYNDERSELGWFQLYYLMQLAPDCRIYVGGLGGSEYLHIIHSPDEKGIACSFEPVALKTALYNHSIPFTPPYRTDMDVPFCNPDLPVSARKVPRNIEVNNERREGLKIIPNPSSGLSRLSFSVEMQQYELTLVVHGINGVEYYAATFPKGQEETSLDVQQWPAGVYIVSVSAGYQVWREKLVVVR